MKYFINDDLALSRPPEGPVTRYIIPFADWLVDRGHGLVSLRNQVLMAAGFSTWLRQIVPTGALISPAHAGEHGDQCRQLVRTIKDYVSDPIAYGCVGATEVSLRQAAVICKRDGTARDIILASTTPSGDTWRQPVKVRPPGQWL